MRQIEGGKIILKKRIISLIIALNMVINLSSCTNKHQNHNSDGNTSWGYEDTLSNNDVKEKEEPIDPDMLANFLTIINNVETPYNFNDYYPTMDTINDYKAVADSMVTCSEEDTNYMQLSDIIEKNTIIQYGKNNGIFFVPGETYSDEELARLSEINPKFKIAIKNAINNIFENATNDIKEDVSKLKSICIIEADLQNLDGVVESDGVVLGLWKNDKLTITIDYDSIVTNLESTNAHRIENGRTEIDLIEYLTRTIEHEINHARQYICENRLKQGQKYENIGIIENPTFFIESSAESELYISKDFNDLLSEKSSDYTYTSERDYETLLFLLTVFKNKNFEGYYNAIFDSNLNEFWEYFKLENSEELKRFYSILYSMDTLCGRTDLTRKICDGKTQLTFGELKEKVGTSYLIDLFKFNIVDLINAIERDNLSLEDSLMLYLYSKSYITDSSYATNLYENEDGKSERAYNDNYVSAVAIIENTFIKYISAKYEISISESKEMLEDFDLSMRLSTFTDYALENDEYCSENDKNDFDKLLKKYPLIKYMLWIYPCDYYNANLFNNYVENNEKKLVLN